MSDYDRVVRYSLYLFPWKFSYRPQNWYTHLFSAKKTVGNIFKTLGPTGLPVSKLSQIAFSAQNIGHWQILCLWHRFLWKWIEKN